MSDIKKYQHRGGRNFYAWMFWWFQFFTNVRPGKPNLEMCISWQCYSQQGFDKTFFQSLLFLLSATQNSQWGAWVSGKLCTTTTTVIREKEIQLFLNSSLFQSFFHLVQNRQPVGFEGFESRNVYSGRTEKGGGGVWNYCYWLCDLIPFVSAFGHGWGGKMATSLGWDIST